MPRSKARWGRVPMGDAWRATLGCVDRAGAERSQSTVPCLSRPMGVAQKSYGRLEEREAAFAGAKRSQSGAARHHHFRHFMNPSRLMPSVMRMPQTMK